MSAPAPIGRRWPSREAFVAEDPRREHARRIDYGMCGLELTNGQIELLGRFASVAAVDRALVGWREWCDRPFSLSWVRRRCVNAVRAAVPA